MGLNDNLIEDYRNVITNTLLNDELLVSLLSNDECDLDSADELMWTHIVPQQYVPDTIIDTGSFIFYDLEENVLYKRGSTNATYTEMTLYFWIFTHKDMPKYRNKNDNTIKLRNDIITRELKLLFNDTGGMGIAKNHLIYNKLYTYGNKEYMGRVMAFKITDWSDDVRLRERK